MSNFVQFELAMRDGQNYKPNGRVLVNIDNISVVYESNSPKQVTILKFLNVYEDTLLVMGSYEEVKRKILC